MGALDLLAEWPAADVAAVVTGPDGVLAAAGPTTQPFPLASVTKVLVALACLVAVEEGTLDLDAPAGPPGSTVAHLLAHASGLSPDEERAVAAPGTRRIYSNAGFEVLGRQLEAASGLPTAVYLDEGVAQPLGLGTVLLAGSPAHAGVASAADLAAVGRELLAPTLISQATLVGATTSWFPDLAGVLPGYGHQDPNPWGLGLEIRGTKTPHWTGRTSSVGTFGHFGRAGTFLWVDPVARLACAVLTDLDFGTWAVERWPGFTDAVLDEFAVGAPGRTGAHAHSTDVTGADVTGADPSDGDVTAG
jgi:CubicO group peptidase (beta-lactamase class C family)